MGLKLNILGKIKDKRTVNFTIFRWGDFKLVVFNLIFSSASLGWPKSNVIWEKALHLNFLMKIFVNLSELILYVKTWQVFIGYKWGGSWKKIMVFTHFFPLTQTSYLYRHKTGIMGCAWLTLQNFTSMSD